jgi:hypothetical protein
VEFRTSQYEFSHGSLPRGRGLWAFGFLITGNGAVELFAPANLLYSEAKQWARAKAKELNACEVVVLP